MSLLLETDTRRKFEERMLKILRKDKSGYFSNTGSINEPRVVAENVQEVCKQHFDECFDKGIIAKNSSDSLSRRAMGDIQVEDSTGADYLIDVKTHNLGTKFNMPNLTSIDRLTKFYSVDTPNNYFFILLVEYEVTDKGVIFNSVRFFPIENLSWKCLRIGALGKGQIQICKASDVQIDPSLSRKKWMASFVKQIEKYYKDEETKAKKRLEEMKERVKDWLD